MFRSISDLMSAAEMEPYAGSHADKVPVYDGDPSWRSKFAHSVRDYVHEYPEHPVATSIIGSHFQAHKHTVLKLWGSWRNFFEAHGRTFFRKFREEDNNDFISLVVRVEDIEAFTHYRQRVHITELSQHFNHYAPYIRYTWGGWIQFLRHYAARFTIDTSGMGIRPSRPISALVTSLASSSLSSPYAVKVVSDMGFAVQIPAQRSAAFFSQQPPTSQDKYVVHPALSEKPVVVSTPVPAVTSDLQAQPFVSAPVPFLPSNDIKTAVNAYLENQASQRHRYDVSEVPHGVVIIDSVLQAQNVCADLLKQQVVALDCEGYNLQHGGRISLIQLTARRSDQDSHPVYIFDLLQCPTAIVSLKPLLESRNILKIVHDGRSDVGALRAQFGINVASIADTQLFFRLLCTLRESSGKPAASNQPIGLNSLLLLYSLPENPYKMVFKERNSYADPMLWEKRLTRDLLEYAVADVAHLIKLFGELREDIEVSTLACGLLLSRKYASTETAPHEAATTAPRPVLTESPEVTSLSFHRGIPVRDVCESPCFDISSPPIEIPPHEIARVLALLPGDVANHVVNIIAKNKGKVVQQIALDTGRPPLVYFNDGSIYEPENCGPQISMTPIIQSIYQQLSSGNKAPIASSSALFSSGTIGIEGTLHKISTITNLAGEIIGITIRFVPTTSPLSPELISDLLACFGDSRQVGFSTLFIGPASVSLPSVLRSMAAVISSGGPAANATRRTLVIDTSGEIGGASDVAVASLGSARRILVPEGTQQAEVLSSALQNQVADVAVIGSISSAADVEVFKMTCHRGISTVAACQVSDIGTALRSRDIRVLLGIHHGWKREPTFSVDVVVQVLQPNKIIIHKPAAAVAKAAFARRPVEVEERWVGTDGLMYSRTCSLLSEFPGAAAISHSPMTAAATMVAESGDALQSFREKLAFDNDSGPDSDAGSVASVGSDSKPYHSSRKRKLSHFRKPEQIDLPDSTAPIASEVTATQTAEIADKLLDVESTTDIPVPPAPPIIRPPMPMHPRWARKLGPTIRYRAKVPLTQSSEHESSVDKTVLDQAAIDSLPPVTETNPSPETPTETPSESVVEPVGIPTPTPTSFLSEPPVNQSTTTSSSERVQPLTSE